jgi:HPt (histidine-containing phosphotransfer) domain-containing protein
MRRYLQRRVAELTLCLEYLECGNFSELEKVGHQLKGKGSTFGHPEISRIGEELERSSARRDSLGVQAALRALTSWVRRVG